MADNFLERRMRDYEVRKAKWLAGKRHTAAKPKDGIERPEDEAL